VVSFERSPEVFDILSAHAKAADGVIAIRQGVGNADEVGYLRHTENRHLRTLWKKW
jgi:hypothetical protein